MKEKTFRDIDEKYELEIARIVETIIKEKAKRVLLQFPDGLKLYSRVIKEEIEKKLKEKTKNKQSCEIFIWLDSCFGACDVPIETSSLGVDLIVQFGHSSWDFKDKDIKVVKS